MSIASIKKQLKLKLLTKLLKGNNVTCPACGHSFSTFLPYLGRMNAQCSNCGSLERTRLIYKFITDNALFTSNTRLLHVAPERTLYRKFEKSLKNYIPVDKFEPGYSYPKKTVSADITDLHFSDASFDAVLCIHVLEHVQEDAKAISELYRVLKPGGIAILQVPFEKDRDHTYEDPTIIDPEERRKHFQQFDHVRIYGADYLQRFLKPGFKMELEAYSQQLSPEVRKKFGLKDEEIFLLRK